MDLFAGGRELHGRPSCCRQGAQPLDPACQPLPGKTGALGPRAALHQRLCLVDCFLRPIAPLRCWDGKGWEAPCLHQTCRRWLPGGSSAKIWLAGRGCGVSLGLQERKEETQRAWCPPLCNNLPRAPLQRRGDSLFLLLPRIVLLAFLLSTLLAPAAAQVSIPLHLPPHSPANFCFHDWFAPPHPTTPPVLIGWPTPGVTGEVPDIITCALKKSDLPLL